MRICEICNYLSMTATGLSPLWDMSYLPFQIFFELEFHFFKSVSVNVDKIQQMELMR